MYSDTNAPDTLIPSLWWCHHKGSGLIEVKPYHERWYRPDDNVTIKRKILERYNCDKHVDAVKMTLRQKGAECKAKQVEEIVSVMILRRAWRVRVITVKVFRPEDDTITRVKSAQHCRAAIVSTTTRREWRIIPSPTRHRNPKRVTEATVAGDLFCPEKGGSQLEPHLL